ncbi:MAG: hypothetical protein ABIQ27_11195 [Flavobacterium sp.]|uniref:hypothetical protein n=1 Tax=Flavobacterium sp. TaxID=239 RepID=UPI003267AACE
METTAIACEKDLMDRIAELKILKSQQESIISEQFKDLKDSLNIGTILKESVAHIAADSETRNDLVKIAATTGTKYVIEKVLGSNNSIKRFLGSMLAEKVSNTFIGKMISKL